MSKRICTFAALAALGASAIVPSSASAQVARGAPALAQAQAQESAVQTVRWRGGWRHGGWRHHRRGYGWGPVLGGFAAGAIVGGALAAQQSRQAQEDWIEYCSAKYRSFDPATGMYTTYGGEQRYCR